MTRKCGSWSRSRRPHLLPNVQRERLWVNPKLTECVGEITAWQRRYNCWCTRADVSIEFESSTGFQDNRGDVGMSELSEESRTRCQLRGRCWESSFFSILSHLIHANAIDCSSHQPHNVPLALGRLVDIFPFLHPLILNHLTPPPPWLSDYSR